MPPKHCFRYFLFHIIFNNYIFIRVEESRNEKPKPEETKGFSNEQTIENKVDDTPKSKVDTDAMAIHTTPTTILLTQQNKDEEINNEKKNIETVKTTVDEKLTTDDVTVTIKDIEKPEAVESIKKPEVVESIKKPGNELKTDNTGSVDSVIDVGEEKTKKDIGMISFTEWKQKLDREKEEVEQINVVDVTTNETVIVPKPKRKKKLSNKKNYASPNCGAKVVAANNEAQHSSAILKEDKDAYMLNPCNVQAWLVVELCERIQLDSIDFANFEMFSSSPGLFTIHVSNRFPTREWEFVQEFNATSGRQIQNFPIKDIFYSKYIKVSGNIPHLKRSILVSLETQTTFNLVYREFCSERINTKYAQIVWCLHVRTLQNANENAY